MLEVIAEKIKDRMINDPEITFLGNVAGLVKVVQTKQEQGNGTFKPITFPVHQNATLQDCFQGGINYSPITPNSQHASVFYFEPKSKLVQTGWKTKTVSTHSANLRLVAWLNYEKIGTGATACYFAEKILKSIIGAYRLDAPFVNSSFSIPRIDIVTGGMDLFRAYTYEKDINLHIMPYDSFALDFKVNVLINHNCVEDVVLNPVVCLNL